MLGRNVDSETSVSNTFDRAYWNMNKIHAEAR